MAEDVHQFVVERSRLVDPIPGLGATRYLVKVVPMGGPDHGAGRFRFQNQAPRQQADNAQIVCGFLGREAGTINDLWAGGRWQVAADDGRHVTLVAVP